MATGRRKVCVEAEPAGKAKDKAKVGKVVKEVKMAGKFAEEKRQERFLGS